MLFRSRVARFSALVLSVLSVGGAAALEAAPAPKSGHAQPASPPSAADPAVPWLYRGSDIPQDKEWIFGELPNGLRYVVRKNNVPPGQVSIRVRLDVGSLYEKTSEMGYSHLLEHLVFRQSKYLGDGEAISAFQRLGATFGSDTNAETGPISTTFKLDLPDANGGKVDDALKYLSGIVTAPNLSTANLRTDVPIVLAEKRENGGAAERVTDQTQQTLFAGQKFGARPVIGTTAALTGATEGSIRAYYQRWYRPENCVIVAVGDIDPAKLEASIKTWFADWKGVGLRTPEPPFGDPVAPKGARGVPPIGETRVIAEPTLPRQITYAVMRPWRPVRDTIVYNQGIMLDTLALKILNRRLESRARAGGSFLVAEVAQDKVARSADLTYVSITPLGPDWKLALKDTRAVIADAMARAPTQDEIDQEVKEFSVIYENSVEQRSLQPSSQLGDSMTAALDIRETIASPDTVLSIFRSAIPQFTPANVLARTRALFRGTVIRAVYVTPQAGESTAQGLKLALATPIAANDNARSDAKPLDFASLPPIGTPQQPIASKATGVEAVEQVDFSNGVKVLLFPTELEPGRVKLKVRFGAGWRAFNPQTAPYAILGDIALVGSGEGQLGQEELDRISAGRKLGFDVDIEDSAFVFSAETRAADLADQLYLFAAKFADPRWDPNPVIRAQALLKQSYPSYATSPQGVLERDFRFYERNKDSTFRTPTPQDYDATSLAGFRQVWEPILKHGPIEIHLSGDFKRSDAVAALAKTFGALPARGKLPAGTAPATASTLAPSLNPVVLHHSGEKDQAAAIIAWPTGGGSANIRESRQLQVLAEVLNNRVLIKLREKLGQSYSPYAVNDWPIDLDGGGKVLVVAQLKPESVQSFFDAADEIASDLVANPVSPDELKLVTEPLKQALLRESSGTTFFMNLLRGATADPVRFAAANDVFEDYTVVSPEVLQALAKKYLKRDTSWRLTVLPQGRSLSSLPVRSTAATPAR